MARPTAQIRTSTSKLQSLYLATHQPLTSRSFPPGVPHSIQALDDGLEILLIFMDGNFDATGTTFMLSDWLAHTPLAVVAKNLGLAAGALGGIPQKDPYIYEASVPPPPLGRAGDEAVPSPQGSVPANYVFQLSKQEKTLAPGGGGWVKIQDSVTNFPVSQQLASALVFVEPNGLRELHWHNNDGTPPARAHGGIDADACCRVAVHHQR